MRATAAGVLVIRDGLVLALVRRDGRGIGLPCGKVEPGEQPGHAAVREAREEVGAEVVLVGQPFFAACGGTGVSTWRADLVCLAPPTTPEEGEVVWVPPAAVCAGPFGEYNRAALRALAPELHRMDLDAAFAAETLEDFLHAAFPPAFRGVAARIVESGATFSADVPAWAPRWSGIPFTRRKERVGGVDEKLATVLFRSHDCLHQLWGVPRLDAQDPDERRAYKRTQMCGEVAVLTLTEFVFAEAWSRVDPAFGPVLDRRNALPLLRGALAGLSTAEIAARIDGVLHQRALRPPAWVREDPVATRFVADYTRMLQDDRDNIERCLEAMCREGWTPPAGPTFRPMFRLDGLELTLWMVEDFFHLARTSPEVDTELAAFNRARRGQIRFPPGWCS